MDRTIAIASYKHAVHFAKLAADYCEMAEQSYAAGLLDAHDLVLMAVGAAGVATQAAGIAADAQGTGSRVIAEGAVSRAASAVACVQRLFASREQDEKLDGLRVRVEGHRLLNMLVAEELRMPEQRKVN